MTTAANPTCPFGKMGFTSKQAALRSVSSMRRGGKSAPSFAYLCETCFAWHLSSQSPQGRRARAKAAWRAVGHRKPESAR